MRLVTRAGAGVLLLLGALVASAAEDREVAGLAAERAGRLELALDHYHAALKALPDPPPLADDVRLRERIIAVVARMSAPPAIPAEAERFALRAKAALKTAEEQKDYAPAAAELRQTVRLAPWWGEAAFNLSVLEEKQKSYDAAIGNAKLYLLATPDAPDAKSVRDHLVELEYWREKAVREEPARVFVYRTTSRLAHPLVYCDDIHLARIDKDRYFVVRLQPGIHTFSLKSRSPTSEGPTMELRPGGTYFVRLDAHGGFITRLRLRFVDEAEARIELKKRKPIDKKHVLSELVIEP